MAPLPPAHIFVVRHGTRLDVTDKKWHLTSPTPYDPPLTYGGFLQARQTGNQIRSLLVQAILKQDQAAQAKTNGQSLPLKCRRFKIVIHSSPFLRCVQTSIGISSGLAQISSDLAYSPSNVIVPRPAPGAQPHHFKSALLRLDSFLGEWLSPDYFELITPPPGPALMLGGAKADLLRREDYSAYTDFVSRKGASSDGFKSELPSQAKPLEADTNGSLTLSSLSSALPAVPRRVRDGYVAPRPAFAISSGGRIPDGFVAHARDACLAVDYQWDSMREPLNFGDGGKLGEEWTAMHNRFRRGLDKLIDWYSKTDLPADLVPSTMSGNGDARRGRGGNDSDEESEPETVVIIVSHGAGCNALIGAITNQPVLMDVAVASLTMASRKPKSELEKLSMTTVSSTNPSDRDRINVDGLYDIRLTASTEHLRPVSFSSQTPTRSSSVSAAAAYMWNPHSRGRTSTLGSLAGPSIGPFTYSNEASNSPDSRSFSASATVGTRPRRGSVAQAGLASNQPSLKTGGASRSSGLWEPISVSRRLIDEDGDQDADDFGSVLPDFEYRRFSEAIAQDETGDRAPATTPSKSELNETADTVQASQLGEGIGGLWGRPQKPVEEADYARDRAFVKRRWTVDERV